MIILFLVDPNIKDMKICLCFSKTLFRIRHFSSLVSNRNNKDIVFFWSDEVRLDEVISLVGRNLFVRGGPHLPTTSLSKRVGFWKDVVKSATSGIITCETQKS